MAKEAPHKEQLKPLQLSLKPETFYGHKIHRASGTKDNVAHGIQIRQGKALKN